MIDGPSLTNYIAGQIARLIIVVALVAVAVGFGAAWLLL